MRRVFAAAVAALVVAVGCADAMAAAPVLQITSAPPALWNQTSATFVFTAGDAVTVTCQIDVQPVAGCATLSATYSNLAQGAHVFTLQGANATPETAMLTQGFTVDSVPPAEPVVAHPPPGTLSTLATIGFDGTAEAGSAVTVSENGTPLQTVQLAAGIGAWSIPITATDGAHAYNVTAADAAGNVSSATIRTLTVDTVAPAPPEIALPAAGSAQRDATILLAGSAERGATVAVLEGTAQRGSVVADGIGNWALPIAGVAEGAHTYTATATDAANHTSAPSARTVVVDRTPPPAPLLAGGPDAFQFSSPESGAALACRLDGPSSAGEFRLCRSPLGFSGLAPGDYTFLVRASDAAGNEATTARAFSIAGGQPAPTATPNPASSPVAAPAVTPSLRQTVVLRPFSGRTLVRRPGVKASEELRAKTAVPVGTTVDVKNGVVVVTAAPSESGSFYGGVFTVTQPAGGVTELALSEPLKCGRTRRLWGDGAGAFRIRGRFGSATGRGSKWLVEDSCTSTVVRVARGVVAVRDDAKRKTLLVRAGTRYRARPKR